jgi:TonB family protein
LLINISYIVSYGVFNPLRRLDVRYFAAVMLVLLITAAGAAFAQENEPSSEEVMNAPVDPELAAIREKVGEMKEVVQADYEVLLETNPEAQGTVTVSFSITPEGTVTDTEIDCPEELEAIETSITQVLGDYEFEPSERSENLPITVPFELMPPE